jgi:alpha-N-arabinofuranosidase
MDEFDPQRRVALVIDEWGTWHLPTAGRNPAFLWQQNTMRDALVAAVTLDTFNRHADKLAMCNIAQVANVLQAMILTEGERLILTPTYHVFDLYQAHQRGQSLRVAVEAPSLPVALGDRRATLAGLMGSASLREGVLTVSFVNPHATFPLEVALGLPGQARAAGGWSLHHDDLAAHNTFEQPRAVEPHKLGADALRDGLYVCPPASVTVLHFHQ